MTWLVLGLVLFLGAHSVRIVAEGWRSGRIQAWGEQGWKGRYTAVSLIGFALIVWGYGQARLDPTVLWTPPLWTRHLAALLTLPAFVLLVAAYVPGTVMKAKLGHPMVLGTKLWAAAHLLANGTLADVLLFGGFLVWAVADFRSARRRPVAAATAAAPARASRDLLAVLIGAVAWAAFAFWAHAWLIGVRPFG